VPIRVTFAQLCRTTRIRLRLTQQELADRIGISRAYVAKIELGQGNPSLALVDGIADALGLDIDLMARTPTIIGGQQKDLVHARCSAYIDRRLRAAGWLTSREVEIVHQRSHGWIDILAFDPVTGTLLVIEIKTRLDDLGAIERQIGWYERSAFEVARGLGWTPRRVNGWLLVLDSDEVERSIRSNRELLWRAFPLRARQMSHALDRTGEVMAGRGLALIDPTTKRQDWLIPSRIDGRRSPATFTDYGDAARRLAV
jgi:transcriptional regulator with XRE-family HTH domain